uniref:Aluminum-activated malate transporter n=1 Tax=Oryza brachyantha TaxID=4533 RepID=J3MDQ2_ORYBR
MSFAGCPASCLTGLAYRAVWESDGFGGSSGARERERHGVDVLLRSDRRMRLGMADRVVEMGGPPFVLTASLFVLAAAASFSRFIPTLKARFDYGVTIFILTYSLVAVSGYRVDTLGTMAHQRLTTIAIGAFICFAVCTLIFPVWAGQELHVLVARNMDKLAAAVEACVDDYFSSGEHPTKLSEKVRRYMAVLNAKASEDSLANLARWEPGHGKFGFRHPYGQYQKVGAAMRCCAYCVDALAACVGAAGQAPPHVKNHLAAVCTALSQHCSAVLREASGSITTMTRSGRLALVVGDMNTAAQDLRDELRCLAEILDEEEAAPSETEHEHNTTTPPPPLDKKETAAAATSGQQEARDQVRQLVKLLMRRRSTKKWGRGEPKVSPRPRPPLDVPPVHAPSPRSLSTELAAHPPVHAPSPRHRSMDFPSHGPVLPSPRNRSMDFTAHAPSPRNRSILGMA